MKPKHFTLVRSSLADPDSSRIGIVAVFRRRGATRLEMGCFIVDRACLGVRDAWYEDLEESALPKLTKQLFDNDFVENEGAWGRKFVEGAVAYARQFGFKPHSGYKKAARVFGGITAADCDECFAYGHEGKPLYVAGPDDSSETTDRIIRQLGVRCGEGNFNYLVSLREGTLNDRVNDLLEIVEGGDIDAGQKGLEQLLEENPDSGLVHFGLGVMANLREDYPACLAHLDEAVRLCPDMAEAWFNKAMAHQKLFQIVPMVFALRRSLDHAEPGQGIAEDAGRLIAIVEKMARDDFGIDLETYLSSGIVFDRAFETMRAGNWSEALAGLEEVARINPRSYHALGNAGTCLIQLGRIREARESLQEALRIKPDYRPALDNLKSIEDLDENNPPPPGILKVVNDAAGLF